MPTEPGRVGHIVGRIGRYGESLRTGDVRIIRGEHFWGAFVSALDCEGFSGCAGTAY
jgi:hypothetical protein